MILDLIGGALSGAFAFGAGWVCCSKYGRHAWLGGKMARILARLKRQRSFVGEGWGVVANVRFRLEGVDYAMTIEPVEPDQPRSIADDLVMF